MLVREPPFPRGGWGVGGLGALIRTANQFQNSDFPTPRGYEQAVHPPFNLFFANRNPECFCHDGCSLQNSTTRRERGGP
jgi:hypothetical protein